MALHAWNLSTRKDAAGGSEVQGHALLHGEFKASLGQEMPLKDKAGVFATLNSVPTASYSGLSL